MRMIKWMDSVESYSQVETHTKVTIKTINGSDMEYTGGVMGISWWETERMMYDGTWLRKLQDELFISTYTEGVESKVKVN